MPVARERSRMEAPSYPFSQKMWLACARTSASRRSNRVSLIGGAALEAVFALRPWPGSCDTRVSTAATGIQETRKRPNERSNFYYDATHPSSQARQEKSRQSRLAPKGRMKIARHVSAGYRRRSDGVRLQTDG